jgi:phage protein D
MAPRFNFSCETHSLETFLNQFSLAITIEDRDGITDDFLCVEALDDKTMELPVIGTQITASLGFSDDLITMGSFFLTSIEANHDKLVFKCSAMKDKKSSKEETFTDEKIEDVVAKIADEYGLKACVDQTISALCISEHKNESGLNFLSRMGRDIGCTAKVCDGRLVFKKKGNGKTVENKDIQEVVIRNILEWNYKEVEEKSYSGVRTYYWDEQKKEPVYVVFGTEENLLEIRYNLVTKLAAENKARAKFNEIKKGSKQLEISVFSSENFNTARLVCGAPIKILGLREGLKESWVIRKITHQLTRDGLMAHIESEEK